MWQEAALAGPCLSKAGVSAENRVLTLGHSWSSFLSFLMELEWSAIEKEMGDGLQSAGHHMDVAVCRKHELMQYDLEMAAQDLASKKQQCEELATGREARIKVLEEQINEGEQQLKSKNQEGREFVKNAWADIERFKEQKNHDLKEALISYAVMQISMCKKGIQVWTNAKECFSKM
eukprot:bmy_02333T0